MNIPDYADTAEFMQWARENKRRADRLARAAREVLYDLRGGYGHMHSMQDLESAATDYEDTRG